MKQKLFLVSALFLAAGATAFADGWQKPTIQGIDPVNSCECYIMNVEAQQFLNGGSVWFSWVTSAALDNEGQVCLLSQSEETEGTWTIARTTDGKFTFTSGNGVTGRQEMHVDGGTATPFNFVKTASGNYNIVWPSAAEEGTSWGWLGNEHAYKNAIYADIIIAEAPTAASCEWMFVSVEDKGVFSTKLACYNKAVALAAAIEKAKSLGVDTSAAEAVYNNLESTLEELTAAYDALVKAIADYEMSLATLDNPVDVTVKIVNPTFDKAGDSTGWTDASGKANSGWGAGGTTSSCAERYQMTFNTWQEINDMPMGVYKVNVDGFYRAGGAEDDFKAEKRQDTFNAMVYGANIVGGEAAEQASSYIMHLSHGIEPGAHLDKDGNDIGGMKVTFEEEDYYVPNSMLDFTNYNGTTKQMEKPFYKTNAVMFPVSEGTLRIGVKNESTLGWTIVDNFGLTYYGNGADAWGVLMEDTKANAAVASDLMVTKSVVDAFYAVVAAASATDYASYAASAAAIAEAKQAVDENVAAWAEYVALAKQATELIADPAYAEVAIELAEYLGYDYADIIAALALTTEEIKAEIEVLKKLYEEAKLLTPPGTDVSGMLTNADFSDGWTGWAHSGNGGAVAVNASAKCAEAWNSGNFDIHQDIENAPVGVYEIQVQGFYRYLRGDNAWSAYFDEDGNKKSEEELNEYILNTPAKIFCNDNLNGMANVFDYYMPYSYAKANWTEGNYYVEPIAEKNEEGEYDDDAKCYPNNMTDAGKAFDEGQYRVSAFGLVAKTGDPLRVGIKGDSNQGGDSWAIFTRFKLVYQGYKAEIIKPELEKALAKIDLTLAMGSDVKAAAKAAKEAGEAALEATGDNAGKTMFDALADIYAIQGRIETSVALFEELNSKLEQLAEKLDDNEASEETIGKAIELLSEIQDAMTGYTDAQATSAISRIDSMLKELAIPAYIVEASEENPIDLTSFIENPSFETGNTNGWNQLSGDGTQQFGAQGNDAFGKSGAYYAERWHAAGNLDMNQAITNLPVGTYVITVDAHCSCGGQLYAAAGENTVETELTNVDAPAEPTTESVKISIADGDVLTIGVKGTLTGDTWFAIDNFTLSCVEFIAYSTGIENIANAQKAEAGIYNLNGLKVATLQQGVNIVRTVDAAGNVQVRKIIIK